MLSIILLILKILGLTILCILGLILVFILLVIFLPIKYKLVIDKPDETFNNIKIRGQVTYFLRLIRAYIGYPNDNLFSLKVLFFRLIPKKEKKLKVQKSKNIKNNEENNNLNKDETVASFTKEERNDLDNHSKNEAIQNEDDVQFSETSEVLIDKAIAANEQEKVENTIPMEKLTLKDRLKNIINRCNATYISIKDKVEAIRKGAINISCTVDHYKSIIDSSAFKKSFNLCKKQIIKIFKIIKPKTIKGNIYFGADSPDVTAEVFGVCSLILPYLGKKFYIYPDLQNKTLTGHILVKGRVHIVSLLIIGLKIFFDRDLKKTLKMFKKE